MKILICDDNINFSEKLKSDILNLKPDWETVLFPTISSLLFALDDMGDSVDGIFLDIKNSDGSGIDAAGIIKEKFPLIKLVFVTGYGDEYSQDIFNCPVGFEPIAFLIKPIKEKYLKTALDKIETSSSVSERYISVTCKHTTSFVNEKNIMYITSDKRQITIYTADNSYTYYEKLDNVIQKLGKNFCRCHRSYIINFDYISTVKNRNTVIMSDDTVIPVGKSYLDEFRQHLILYKTSDKKEVQ